VTEGHYIHDCLELIKTKMLRIDIEDRAECKEVHECLARYHQRCLQDAKYAEDSLQTFHESASAPIVSPFSIPSIEVTSDLNNASTRDLEGAYAERVPGRSVTSTISSRSSMGDMSGPRNEQAIDHADTDVLLQSRSCRSYCCIL
jgi:hypothetical protein